MKDKEREKFINSLQSDADVLGLAFAVIDEMMEKYSSNISAPETLMITTLSHVMLARIAFLKGEFDGVQTCDETYIIDGNFDWDSAVGDAVDLVTNAYEEYLEAKPKIKVASKSETDAVMKKLFKH
jgi:hypothetical protein